MVSKFKKFLLALTQILILHTLLFSLFNNIQSEKAQDNIIQSRCHNVKQFIINSNNMIF